MFLSRKGVPVYDTRQPKKIAENHVHRDFYECGPLLLPDEYCLAEDENANFHLNLEKKRFHLFGKGVWVLKMKSRIYLTNYRVSPLDSLKLTNG